MDNPNPQHSKPKPGKIPLDQMSQEDLINQIKRQVVLLHKSKSKCDELTSKIRKLESNDGQSNQFEIKCLELEDQIKSSKEYIKQILEEHELKMSEKDQSILEINSKFEQTLREKWNAEEQVQCMTLKLSTLTETSKFLQMELTKIQEEKQASLSQIELLSEARNSAISSLKSAKEMLVNTETRVRLLETGSAQLSEDKSNLVSKLEALVSEVQELSLENERLERHNQEGVAKLKSAIKDCDSWKIKVEELENEKDDYVCPMADVTELQSKIEELENELRKALKEKDRLNYQLQQSNRNVISSKLADVPEETECANNTSHNYVRLYGKDVHENLDSALRLIRNLESNLSKSDEQKSNLVEELCQVKDLQRFLEDEAKELHEECNKLKGEVKRLEADLENDALHILQLDQELREAEERENCHQKELEMLQSEFSRSGFNGDALTKDHLDEVTSLKDEVKFYRDSLIGLETENSDLKSSLDEMKAEFDEQNLKEKDMMNQIREMKSVIQNRTDEMKIEEYEKEKEILEGQLLEERERIEELSVELVAVKNELEKLSKNGAKLNTELVNNNLSSEEIDSNVSSADTFQIGLSLGKSTDNLVKSTDNLNTDMANNVSVLEEKNLILREELQKAKEREGSVLEALKDKSIMLENIHSQVDNLITRLDEANEILFEKEKDLSSLTCKYQTALKDVQMLSGRMAELETAEQRSLKDLEEYESQNNALHAELAEKSERFNVICSECSQLEGTQKRMVDELKTAKDNLVICNSQKCSLEAVLVEKDKELVNLMDSIRSNNVVPLEDEKEKFNALNKIQLCEENEALIEEYTESQIKVISLTSQLKIKHKENALLLKICKLDSSLREYTAELEFRLDALENNETSDEARQIMVDFGQQILLHLNDSDQQTDSNEIIANATQTETKDVTATAFQTDLNEVLENCVQTEAPEVNSNYIQTEMGIVEEYERVKIQFQSLEEKHASLLKEMLDLSEKVRLKETNEIQLRDDNQSVMNGELAASKDKIEKLKRVIFKLKKEMSDSNKVKDELSTVSRQHLSNFQSLQLVNDRLQDEFENAKENSQKLNQDLSSLIAEMITVKEQNANLNADLVKLQASLESTALEKKVQEELKMELESKLIVAKSEKETEENKLKNIKVDITKLETRIKVFEEQLKSEKESHTATIHKLEENLKQSKQHHVLSLEIGHFEEAIAELETKLTEKETLVATLKSETEQFAVEQTNLKEHLGKSESKCLMEESRNECLKHALEKIKKELSEAKDSNETSKSERDSLQMELEKLNVGREELQVELANATTRIRTVEDYLKAAKENHAKSVRALESRITTLELETNVLQSDLKSNKLDFENYKVRVHSVLKQKQQPTSSPNSVEIAQVERFEKTVENLHEKVESLKEALRAKTTEMETFQLEYDHLASRHSKLVEELSKKDQFWAEKQEHLTKDKEATLALFEAEKSQLTQQRINSENILKQQIRNLIEEHKLALEMLEKQLEVSEKEAISYQKELFLQKTGANNSLPITHENEIPFDISGIERQEGEGSECTGTGTITPTRNIPRATMISSSGFTPLEQLLQSPTSCSSADAETTTANLGLANRKVDHLAELLNESEASNMRFTEQVRLLKEEIRRLERNKDREEIVSNLEYLKNVVVKFVTLQENNERERLVPVLTTMLKLSPDEQQQIQRVAKGEVSGAPNANNWGSYLPRWSGLM